MLAGSWSLSLSLPPPPLSHARSILLVAAASHRYDMVGQNLSQTILVSQQRIDGLLTKCLRLI
jgi:hypothetical protein